MCKLQPKISGCFRTMKGAMIFPRLLWIVNTARKRGWNVIEILGGSPERFIGALGNPAEVLDAFENCLKGEARMSRSWTSSTRRTKSLGAPEIVATIRAVKKNLCFQHLSSYKLSSFRLDSGRMRFPVAPAQ